MSLKFRCVCAGTFINENSWFVAFGKDEGLSICFVVRFDIHTVFMHTVPRCVCGIELQDLSCLVVT